MAQGPAPVSGTTVQILRPPRRVLSFERVPRASETDCDSTCEDEGSASPLKSSRNVHIVNGQLKKNNAPIKRGHSLGASPGQADLWISQRAENIKHCLPKHLYFEPSFLAHLRPVRANPPTHAGSISALRRTLQVLLRHDTVKSSLKNTVSQALSFCPAVKRPNSIPMLDSIQLFHEKVKLNIVNA